MLECMANGPNSCPCQGIRIREILTMILAFPYLVLIPVVWLCWLGGRLGSLDRSLHQLARGLSLSLHKCPVRSVRLDIVGTGVAWVESLLPGCQGPQKKRPAEELWETTRQHLQTFGASCQGMLGLNNLFQTPGWGRARIWPGIVCDGFRSEQ